MVLNLGSVCFKYLKTFSSENIFQCLVVTLKMF
jgi:hypothetical protein